MVFVFISGNAEVSRDPGNLGCDAMGKESLRSWIDLPC